MKGNEKMDGTIQDKLRNWSDEHGNVPADHTHEDAADYIDRQLAENKRIMDVIRFRVYGWREWDWPENFDR